QTYYIGPFSIGILANEREIEENATRLVKQYDVRTPSIFVNIGALSGGNQQKAVVAREFSRENHLLIAAQPTRGLDVGSIEFIH
ncbi:MAG: heme ABC transporter ATP-binding protein, partial [Anaerolineae bacterium]|nr:heme ABC transporter ATP-binding protein [Phycisphaerae bacterium]